MLQEDAVAVVRAAVVEVSEVEPVGGLADQPAGDAAATVGRLDVQVFDVGEAVLGDEAAGVAALLDLSR